ncbi:hypothetical protein Gpo141_00002260 [Globisporangium polare]
MAREELQPPTKKQYVSGNDGAILDAKIDASWSKSSERDASNSSKDSSNGVLLEYATSYAHAPLVYVDAKEPESSIRSSNNSSNMRKRPLSSSPVSAPFARGGNVAFTDFKLDFGGYEMGSSAASQQRASPSPLSQYVAVIEENPHEVIELLKSLNLTIRLDPTVLSQVADKLMYYGFDTVLALAFATMDDLQHCGLHNHVDYQLVYQEARRDFAARQFHGPGAFSNGYTVSRWLMLCSIPKKSAFEYTERLCRLGYPSVNEFELIIHDERALSEFRIGHRRLFVHCVTVAINQAQHQVALGGAGSGHQSAHMSHHAQHAQHYGPVYDGGSSSALLQPLEIHRETEFDSFLDALIDPSGEPPRYSVAPSVDSFHHNLHSQQQQHHHHHHGMHDDHGSGDSDEGEYGDSDFFPSAAGSADHMLMSMNYGSESVAPASSVAMRNLPYEVVQLLYEAVNMSRPNPCRRGKKIYWSVLANNGMKEERFAVLESYTAAELQNAYLRQFELPANNPVKTDSWSEENIRQLENAVKDPRCRHLSKVCWEMLATGRTGVDEYAPLAKFTASQLRSRFRSLFGDKRPQKLRQKKQMLKLQQQEGLKKL